LNKTSEPKEEKSSGLLRVEPQDKERAFSLKGTKTFKEFFSEILNVYEVKLASIPERVNDCAFLCPFTQDPNLITCMKAFKTKDKIIKLPKSTCQFCHDKGFIIKGSAPTFDQLLEQTNKQEQAQKTEIPQESTFYETFVKPKQPLTYEEQEKIYQEKRTAYNKATSRIAPNSDVNPYGKKEDHFRSTSI
jgi:hypothetical protein